MQKSDVGSVIRYALGHWPALVRHAGGGRIENDNAEGAIAPFWGFKALPIPLRGLATQDAAYAAQCFSALLITMAMSPSRRLIREVSLGNLKPEGCSLPGSARHQPERRRAPPLIREAIPGRRSR